jgi:CIC family chloride channel protein
MLLAAAAAFTSRWLVRRFAPEAAGSGVQHVEAVIRGDAVSPGPAVVPVKFVGGVLALGAGLALGREGPTVQMGATIGHLWSRAFGLRAGESRVLLAAGAGAGLAAAFNAPLAGAIFVFEELLRRFELRTAVSTLSACGAALVVMRVLLGDRLVFSVPPIVVELFPGFFLLLAAGALFGLLGIVYSRMVVAGLDLVERARGVPPEVVAALIGAIVGLVAFFSPTWVGSGESDVQSVLSGSHTLGAMVILFVARLVLGPLCYAPGLPGGLFAPLLAVGATAGIIVGIASESLLPMLSMPLPGYAAIGMGALFVAVVRAPLTGIALVVEMTGARASSGRCSSRARAPSPCRRCSAAGRSTTRCKSATRPGDGDRRTLDASPTAPESIAACLISRRSTNIGVPARRNAGDRSLIPAGAAESAPEKGGWRCTLAWILPPTLVRTAISCRRSRACREAARLAAAVAGMFSRAGPPARRRFRWRSRWRRPSVSSSRTSCR